ncbi:MAG TPA: SAM hydroxide adenosyltransferase, partial [Actinomycetota bacterium]|nr:SAM hydroxide adenosyltransferase [Actinomycetota bacterium]
GLTGDDLVLTRDRSTHPLRRVDTFGDLDAGSSGLLEDSAGWLAVVVNGASAADVLGLGRGDGVELTGPHRVGGWAGAS